MAFGRIVRSQYAHARIRYIDAAAARAVPGILDVILPDDVGTLPLVSTGPILDMPCWLGQGPLLRRARGRGRSGR